MHYQKDKEQQLTIVDINGHSNFVNHCNSILQSFTVGCSNAKELISNAKYKSSKKGRKIKPNYLPRHMTVGW